MTNQQVPLTLKPQFQLHFPTGTIVNTSGRDLTLLVSEGLTHQKIDQTHAHVGGIKFYLNSNTGRSRIIVKEGSIETDGKATLRVTGKLRCLRSHLMVQIDDPSTASPLTLFHAVAQNHYLGRYDDDAFKQACDGLAQQCVQVADLVTPVQEIIKTARGFQALKLIDDVRKLNA